MLFGSLIFVCLFLPFSLIVYHWLRVSHRQGAAKWFMVAASVFFYGWWDVHYVPLVVGSIIANFWLSRVMEKRPHSASLLLGIGIGANLVLLGYYKYANFFVSTVDALTGLDWTVGKILLPLAISFFTFQQIAYLIESRRDGKAADSFVDYALFVLFFPHLIAGPITHHKEMLPQFAQLGAAKLPASYIKVGTAIFILGLAKKVIIADSFAIVANAAFGVTRTGGLLNTSDAWLGALGYSLQLYFDFSGYSDMAIGLGLMFGILLPVNFASPYKSLSIVDFWRRWHISLSRFLRVYLYIGLGGNRKGPVRRQMNLMATMILGGLWHGAGWTFLCWGALHGLYLVINHFWRSLVPKGAGGRAGIVLAWLLTMLCVVVAWVLFRAETFSSAWSVLTSMAGVRAGLPFSPDIVAREIAWVGVIIGIAVCVLLPNVLEMTKFPHSTPGMPIEHDGIVPVRWSINPVAAAVILGVIGAFAFVKLPDPGIFLYFNF